jgi:hypothetical protein
VFDILAGEPAMTIVPGLLATEILAIVVSLIFLMWATAFVRRKHGALVLSLARERVEGAFANINRVLEGEASAPHGRPSVICEESEPGHKRPR